MDSSSALQVYGSVDIGDDSDGSSLSNLSSPLDLPDNFGEQVSTTPSREPNEPPRVVGLEEAGEQPSTPAPTVTKTSTEATLNSPRRGLTPVAWTAGTARTADAEGEPETANAVEVDEQIPKSPPTVICEPTDVPSKNAEPLSGAVEHPSATMDRRLLEKRERDAPNQTPEDVVCENSGLPSIPCSASEGDVNDGNQLKGGPPIGYSHSLPSILPSPSAPQPFFSQDELPSNASLSTLTDISEPFSSLSAPSSQATTPADAAVPSLHVPLASPKAPTSLPRRRSIYFAKSQSDCSHSLISQSSSFHPPETPLSKRNVYNVRPKASIPLDLTPQEYAGQCVAAAESSRLSPHALHEEELALLRQHISRSQVTTYLNIRNGILRLWLRKPRLAITRNEAIGCAKESRWFDTASVCFDWLVRRGYINYGCVEFKHLRKGEGSGRPPAVQDYLASQTPQNRKPRIVVIGAGMAGLGCARQLHNLFREYSDRFHEQGVEVPEVTVLEGRNRIGGRVYSRAFQIQSRNHHPDFRQSRCTAEMGGMIVTGFDRGNPMNTLVRGQLGLGYHALLSTTTIYDINGRPVNAARDGMVENLFNECLDRVSEYKFKIPVTKPVEGNRDLMNSGRDSSSDGQRTIATAEEIAANRRMATTGALSTEWEEKQSSEAPELPGAPQLSPPNRKPEATPQVDLVPVSSDRLTGRTNMEPGTLAALNAAHKIGIMGWALKPGVTESRDLDLDPAAQTAGATLGFVVEEAIRQYSELVDLNSQDFRLLNWHIANLEYSNAINHNCLSLFGWDIDAGNEWEGKHSMIVGGYQSVPRGLMLCPTPLDVRRQMTVTKIFYSGPEDNGHLGDKSGRNLPVVVECENGDAIEADYVVNTIPLGVLKYGSVEFDPPLPTWKSDAIKRIGYGVLNKIILTYREPFWDTERDIFGVLREPANRFSLNQKEYSHRRGRMFQWFNVSKTTGIPCLVALMAGDAAFDTEKASNDELIAEATSILRSIFGPENVLTPIEAVVTRWGSDRFSRGSYSSAGPDMKIDDYDTMARPVGKHLYFAGEHTIGTHPATVHGAYLSGLRVASEIVDELLGPIQVPTPLVPARETVASAVKRKLARADEDGVGDESSASASASASDSVTGSATRSSHILTSTKSRRRLDTRELCIQEHVFSKLGERPTKPQRVTDTSYLLFSRANYDRARQKCEEGRRPGKGRPLPNEIRVLTSKMWRSASAEERRPFAEQAAAEKQMYELVLKEYDEKAAVWDQRAAEVRAKYEKEHPDVGLSGTVTSTTPATKVSSPSALSAPESASAATAPAKQSASGGGRPRRVTSYQASDGSDIEMAI